MTEWPAKLEVTAERFDSMDSDALFEWIGPWFFGALIEAEAPHAPRIFQLSAGAYWVWTEAENGGIEQYFANGAIGAAYVPEILCILGRERAVKLFNDAASQLPKDFQSWDLDTRWKFASENSVIAGLSDDFWESLDDNTFAADFAKLIRQHRSEFEPYFSTRTAASKQ